MSRELPYFRWYPSDAQSDLKYRSLSRAEKGLFHDALDFSWMNDGLPDNDAAIGRALNMTVKELKTLWPSVRECFHLSEEGKLRNNRQEQERAAALLKSEKSTKAANTRHHGSAPVMRPHDSGNADGMPRAYGSGSGYGSGSKVLDTESFLTKSGVTLDELESAWDRHLKHIREEPKDLAFQRIIGMDGKFDVSRFRDRHADFCEAWDTAGWQYCPLTFLAWIEAGMPVAPPKPVAQMTRAERIAARL